MLISTLVMSLLVDAYIYFDIRKSTKNHVWRRLYLLSAIICWVFLVVTLSMPRRSEDSGILGIMWMLYSYLSVYMAKIVYIIVSIIGRLIGKLCRKHLKFSPSRIVGCVCGVVVLAVMWIGVFVTRRSIDVENVEVVSSRLPESFEGYTIAQISDLHVGTWGKDTTFLSKLVDSVNSLNADMVVFTGDIVNRKSEELKPFMNVLSRLSAKDGVYSILGNHDYGDYVDWHTPEEKVENLAELRSMERSMGWILLDNERRVISNGQDSIVLIGVENWGEPPFHVYGDLKKALPSSPDSIHNMNDADFKILLSHNPEHWNREVSKITNIDLTLSGHTHAMQMMIGSGRHKWSPAAWRYPQWSGLYSRELENGGNSQLYVNIGAGEVGMPARLLNAIPEITLITLTRPIGGK